MADVAGAVLAGDHWLASGVLGPRIRATSRIETGEPEQTLYAAIEPVSRETTDSRAARLARATSATCTKSRTWAPSSKTRGASPRSSEDRKIAATPEYGVSRGMPGP